MITVTFNPKTHKLVPIEPTDSMILAGDAEMDGISHLGSAWDLMIAAAPDYPADQIVSVNDMVAAPYIVTKKVVTDLAYNLLYGDDRICECGHSYYRHFDSYENMENAGCKYCGCMEFVEALPAAPKEGK